MKIPTTVITGFLGAGKTTLIRHLLGNSGGRRIALVINEFGDLGVDGELLRGCGEANCSQEDIVELANGCICCTVAEDFIPTMRKLVERADPPDHIVIETSGLALPQSLVHAFNWPEIRTRVTVDGVVAVVDGKAVLEGRFAQDEEALARMRAGDDTIDHQTPLCELFEDQLACADLIIVNKADLMEASEAEGLGRHFRSRVRAGVGVVVSRRGKVCADILLGLDAAAETDGTRAPTTPHDKGDGHDHDHDHDAFESFVVERGAIGNPDEFIEIIAETIRHHEILRLKGFAVVTGKPMRLVVQAVGPRIETYYDRPLGRNEARRTRLVVIGGAGLDRAAIAAALQG